MAQHAFKNVIHSLWKYLEDILNCHKEELHTIRKVVTFSGPLGFFQLEPIGVTVLLTSVNHQHGQQTKNCSQITLLWYPVELSFPLTPQLVLDTSLLTSPSSLLSSYFSPPLGLLV